MFFFLLTSWTMYLKELLHPTAPKAFFISWRWDGVRGQTAGDSGCRRVPKILRTSDVSRRDYADHWKCWHDNRKIIRVHLLSSREVNYICFHCFDLHFSPQFIQFWNIPGSKYVKLETQPCLTVRLDCKSKMNQTVSLFLPKTHQPPNKR